MRRAWSVNVYLNSVAIVWISVGWVEPPEELMSLIFPWVEDEQKNLKARRDALGTAAVDNTLAAFLEVLS